MVQPCCCLVTKQAFHPKGVLSPYRPQTFGLEDWIMGPVKTIQEDGTVIETQELGAWVNYQTCEKHGGYRGPGGAMWIRKPEAKYHPCGMEIEDQ